jgi:hypothetical protein
MDLGEISWRSVEWIQLAQDRDRWRALVNTVMNLRVSFSCKNKPVEGVTALLGEDLLELFGIQVI